MTPTGAPRGVGAAEQEARFRWFTEHSPAAKEWDFPFWSAVKFELEAQRAGVSSEQKKHLLEKALSYYLKVPTNPVGARTLDVPVHLRRYVEDALRRIERELRDCE